MKLRIVVAAISVSISAFAAAAEKHDAHEHRPLHGGVVVEASDMDFELVAKPDVVIIYVRDHGKPASTQGATGRLVLVSGGEKLDAALTPAGENKLEARGNFKLSPGTKAVATVTLAGKKPANVRFALK